MWEELLTSDFGHKYKGYELCSIFYAKKEPV
jgi:hypothetical protein